MMRQVSPKLRHMSIRLHGVTFQKATIFMLTAARNSNPTIHIIFDFVPRYPARRIYPESCTKGDVAVAFNCVVSVRQKYLTIWQHSCEWNCWRGEFVLERPSSETRSISVAMERWSVEHRAFAVETYLKNNDSVIVTQRIFLPHFNIHRNDSVPSRNTVLLWVRNFRETAYAAKKKTFRKRAFT